MGRGFGAKNFSAREKKLKAENIELKARLKAVGEAMKKAKKRK